MKPSAEPSARHPDELVWLDHACTPSTRTAVLALAVEGFMEDPFYAWFAPAPPRRRALLASLLSTSLARCAVAIIAEPGRPDQPLGLVAVHDPERPPMGGPRLPWRLLPLLALRRTWRALALYRRLTRARPRTPHLHVELLAVSEGARGQGLGRRLLGPVLASADRRGLPTHLETTNPVNLPIYERFGFAVVPLPTNPGAPCPAWAMRRPAS